MIMLHKGDKYERLTAVGFTRQTKDVLFWEFMCECGKTVERNIKLVISGKYTQCTACGISQRSRDYSRRKLELYRQGKKLQKEKSTTVYESLLSKNGFSLFVAQNNITKTKEQRWIEFREKHPTNQVINKR